jgi:hypothetical protein
MEKIELSEQQEHLQFFVMRDLVSAWRHYRYPHDDKKKDFDFFCLNLTKEKKTVQG